MVADNPSPSDFEQAPYFGKKDQTKTYREIVLTAIEKCRIEYSKQMTKGGNYFIDGIVVNLPDQREVYVNTVKILYELLFSHRDDDAIKNIDKILKSIEGLYQKYFDKYLEREWWIPYKEQAVKEARMVEGDASGVAAFLTQQREDERLELYLRMFRELMGLFERKNELSTKRRVSIY